MNAIRIIHIETATTTCSVAAGENGVLLAVRSVHEGYKHAENLLRLGEEDLQDKMGVAVISLLNGQTVHLEVISVLSQLCVLPNRT